MIHYSLNLALTEIHTQLSVLPTLTILYFNNRHISHPITILHKEYKTHTHTFWVKFIYIMIMIHYSLNLALTEIHTQLSVLPTSTICISTLGISPTQSPYYTRNTRHIVPCPAVFTNKLYNLYYHTIH